jgi:hypothetical protein
MQTLCRLPPKAQVLGDVGSRVATTGHDDTHGMALKLTQRRGSPFLFPFLALAGTQILHRSLMPVRSRNERERKKKLRAPEPGAKDR